MSKRRWMLWTLVLAGWILIGLSFSLNYYFFANHYVTIFRKQPSLGGMLVWELPYWILWAALAPLIFWLTRAFPMERKHRLRNIVIHIAAFLLLSVAHRVIYLFGCWILEVTAYRNFPSIIEMYKFLFFFNLPTGFMSYATILLVRYSIDYYHQYQEEELKASRLKAELAEAQLQALKMQLHPHFLFNTLNSISALLDEDVEAADEMLARLGDFLRLTLENSGAQEVTLEEEMQFLRCYLEIERVRFQDRLTVRMKIEPATLRAQVPNLILQPIVENAIRHGVAHVAGPGCIEVAASLDNGSLRLRVTDNGCGMGTSGELPGNGFREGVGLTNTRARLQQLYGANHSFEMSDAPEGGLQVTLTIPLQYPDRKGGDSSDLTLAQEVAFG